MQLIKAEDGEGAEVDVDGAKRRQKPGGVEDEVDADGAEKSSHKGKHAPTKPKAGTPERA